jgi:intein/homing endonuclease
MESSLNWIHTAPQSVRIAYLQGFFESAGEIEASTMTLLVTVLPCFIDDILRLLSGLGVKPAVVDLDPPTLALDLREIKRIPLLSPIIKDGKYYDVRSALQAANIETSLS